MLLESGFKTGDKVVAINDQKLKKILKLVNILLGAEAMTMERDGEEKVINLPEDFLGQLSDEGK